MIPWSAAKEAASKSLPPELRAEERDVFRQLVDLWQRGRSFKRSCRSGCVEISSEKRISQRGIELFIRKRLSHSCARRRFFAASALSGSRRSASLNCTIACETCP